LDLAIEGHGFFQVKDPSGKIVFSRAGNFAQNACGQIVVESAKTGRLLEPAITLPNDATSISISPEGVVSYQTPSSTTLFQAGTIQMANFINPGGLLKIGENLYEETDGSGTCQTGVPGSNGFGKLRQGWTEQSNVDLRQEIAEWRRIRQTRRSIHSLLDDE
jgi:flagellar basal-body rod protein FlgG